MALKKLALVPGINREVTSLAGKGGYFDCDKVRFRSGFPERIGGWTPLTQTGAPFLGTGRSLINWISLDNADLLGIGTHLKYYVEAGGTYNDITPLKATTVTASNAFTTTAGSATVQVTVASHGCANGDFIGITTKTTTVSSLVSDIDVVVNVASTTDFATVGAVWIDSELIVYTGVTATSFTGCIRGAGGTSAVSHDASTTVYIDVGGISGSILNDNYSVTVVGSNDVNIGVAALATSTATSGYASVALEVPTGGDIYTVGRGWGAGAWGGGTTRKWNRPADTGIGIQLRLWNQSNFGEWLLLGVRGSALYVWKPNASPSIFDRATKLTAEAGASDVPTIHNHFLVSDVSRFAICFGVNDYGSADLDPMLIRWSDQESIVNWTPSITNQASFQRLSKGSYIVTAKQTGSEILVWTDTSVYSMQYIGPPYVWGLSMLMDNVSLMSTNAVVVNDSSVVWMGKGNFYIYDGQVKTLPCSVRRYVFDDMNNDQAAQVVSGINGVYDELWWFYCSAGSNEIDRYVIYNDAENLWYYGTLNRTAWLYSPVRQHPMAVKDGQVYYHESGDNDGETNPAQAIDSYVQTSDIDIDDGDRFAFVWRTVPDITFDGSTSANPQATLSIKARRNPGASYLPTASGEVISADNYTTAPVHLVQRFTQYVYTRVRGRQISLRVGSNSLGTLWRMGMPRIDVKVDGRG